MAPLFALPVDYLRRFAVLKVVLVGMMLSGCESLRLHDEGRLEAAQGAATAAAGLTEQSGSAFGLMENNLDAVRATQTELRALTNQHEYETFQVIAASLTADEIADQLIEVMGERNAIFGRFALLEKAAVDEVNDQLDRQVLIKEALNEETSGDRNLQGTLERVNARLKWVDAGLERFEQIQNAVDPETGELGTKASADLSGSAKKATDAAAAAAAAKKAADDAASAAKNVTDPAARKAADDAAGAAKKVADDAAAAAKEAADDAANKDLAAIAGLVGDAQNAIERIDQDEQVQGARTLLNATILETTAAEQARLSELRRYLAEIKRLRERLVVRDRISVCNLYLDSLPNLIDALPEDTKERLQEVTKSLSDSGRYDIEGEDTDAEDEDTDAEEAGPCLDQPDLFGDPAPVSDFWVGKSLESFMAASLDFGGEPAMDHDGLDGARSSAQFVGAIGILLFYEREMYENALLDLAREQHRHSIRLSAVNAGQRAQIVHQLAQGLAIYYQGGVKPEEFAQLMLLAAQVGGIFFVGSQV